MIPPVVFATLVKRAARAVAFARHIPPAKLIRRIELTARRKLTDRFPVLAASPRTPLPQPDLAPQPPMPLFPARTGSLTIDENTLRFTFLDRDQAMPLDRMNWLGPGPDPAHQLWRMNLHYMEYLESLPQNVFCALVTAWIKDHPHGKPGAWRDSWNSYALSLRVVVWMQQLARRRTTLPVSCIQAIETSLVDQLRFLMHNLETDLGGNHLIKNIKALIWGSAYFTGPEPDHWRTRALTLLQTELNRQILPDGVHDERSPSYHCQVFADLIECRHALGSGPFNGMLDQTLARMAQATADLTHPDGFPAQFNDAGLSMAYAPSVCLDAYARLGHEAPGPRAIFAFPSAGYYGLRTHDTALIADCGRIAPDDLPAHGHGDVLSFELSVAGSRLIVDQGVFEYIAGEKRQQSRSAANHNTLCFDGADQADFFGAFRCGRRPAVTVRHYAATASSFSLEGTHDGFSNLPGSPRHVRRFIANPGSLEIRDTIEGDPPAPAAITFLLHPAATPSPTPTGAIIRHESGHTVELTSSLPVTIEPAVWWPDMGRELQTHRLRITVPTGVRNLTSRFDWT